MNARTLGAVVGCLVMLTGGRSFADDDLVEKVAVRNRLYTTAGRFEIGANADIQLISRLTQHYNFNASVAYNLVESAAVELRGGYAYSLHTGLADKVSQQFASNPGIPTIRDLADTWQMGWNVTAGLRWQPLYGKINLLAELPVHFQFYVWLGGGVGGFKRESILICNKKSASPTGGVAQTGCDAFLTDNKVSPIVYLAIGFRFFISESNSIKIEVRDFSFLDSYLENVNRASALANNPQGGGTPAASPGITNLVGLNVGYAYIF